MRACSRDGPVPGGNNLKNGFEMWRKSTGWVLEVNEVEKLGVRRANPNRLALMAILVAMFFEGERFGFWGLARREAYAILIARV